MVPSVLAATLFFKPAARVFGFHAVGIELKGDQLKEIPQLLRACKWKSVKTRAIKTKEALKPFLDRDDGLAMGYFANGWTHLYDPSLTLFAFPEVWQNFTKKHDSKVILWCCEDTSGTYGFYVFDHGTSKRQVDIMEGKLKSSGKPLPEEKAIKWPEAGSDDILGLLTRLGTPFDFYERKPPFTVFEDSPVAK